MTGAERRAAIERTAYLTRCGYSARRIAEEFGVTARTVVRWRHEAGVSDDPAPYYPPKVWVAVEAMLDDGASFSEIVRTFGVSRATLTRHYPGRQWTIEESLKFAVETRVANRVLKGIA